MSVVRRAVLDPLPNQRDLRIGQERWAVARHPEADDVGRPFEFLHEIAAARIAGDHSDGARFSSVVTAIVKSALFGFIAATIAFYKGLNVRDGSREISEATTQAVVASVVVITLTNAFVTGFALV